MSSSLMVYELLLLIVLTLLGRVLYRLTLHPLAHFPGPKLAGISGLYKFYFSVLKSGSFHLELQRLHKTYGPLPPPFPLKN